MGFRVNQLCDKCSHTGTGQDLARESLVTIPEDVDVMPALPFRLLSFSLYGNDIVVEATPATILLDLRTQLVRELPRIDWDSVLLYLGTDELSWNDTVANQQLTDGVRILIGFRGEIAQVAVDMVVMMITMVTIHSSLDT